MLEIITAIIIIIVLNIIIVKLYWEIKFKSYMYMVKIQKFCNNNNDDNLNKKKAILYSVHYIWWATRLGRIEFFKNSGHSLELLLLV